MQRKDFAESLKMPGAQPAPARPLSRRLFAIAADETSFARRGFRCDSAEVRARLEGVASTFVEGYHAALEDSRPGALAARLEQIPAERRGFAYEGAGMGLALLDTLTPWNRGRLDAFLSGAADAHTYIVHVGAGWILARLPLSPERLLRRFDPIRGWLALDGYGFHEGFFHLDRTVARHEVPGKVRGYAVRAFDQGLGRSLWFVEGASPERIQATLASFPHERLGDLWSGAGLACAYAGGAPGDNSGDPSLAQEMLRRAGEHGPQLAQGIAFAVVCRERAGNPAPQTEAACRAVWGLGTGQVAELVERANEDLPPERAAEPAFEAWRRRIMQRFTERGTTS